MQPDQDRILIVDDDVELRDMLERYLREQGLDVGSVADGVAMDGYLANHPVDLIILDLMLPGEDGFALARRLHATSNHPIIMLSARGGDVDRIVGLEVGADDYLAKPFNPRELLARIKAVLRRHRQATTEESETVYSFGPYRLDVTSQTLTRDGEPVALTTAEFTLIRIFAQHPGRVLSRDRLGELVQGVERMPFDRSIDVRVTRLRRKIEPDPNNPCYIRTVWGSGYLFAPRGTAG
jgi:two-component system, OmpR family, phosphate regulon response regulator OmpR